VVPVLGVLGIGVLEADELEPVSLLVPVALLLVPPAVPAPIEVPPPVLVSALGAGLVPVVAPAVVVLELEPVVPPMVPLLLLVVSLGGVVVDGVVLEVVDDVDEVSSCLVQALRDRAAIRARAAHCAIGDLIIRNSLRISFDVNRERVDSVCCLRLTLVRARQGHVVCY
jgi:hypothetical protein